MFNKIPTVVKNLIIINVLMFLASMAFPALDEALTGYNFLNDHFRPWQIVTHMFMHGGLTHLFFNMYALFMFGTQLENYWGPKRFLTYYMISGIGAFMLYEGINYIEIQQFVHALNPDLYREVVESGRQAMDSHQIFIDPVAQSLNVELHGRVGVVGASGAVFGLLLAFGMMFPNLELMLMFIPVPIKAKWFVTIYGVIELYQAIRQSPGDNVAHFAHIG